MGCEETTGVWYIYKDGEWKELGLKNHSHSTFGDVNFTGTISVGETLGVTGEVEMVRDGGGKVKLTFTKGIVTEIEEED